MQGRPGPRLWRRRRGSGRSVVANCRKGRGVESHVSGRGDRTDKGREWGMGVGCPGCAAGVVLCDNLVDRRGKVHKEVVLEVARRAGQVGVVGLGELGDAVNKCKEVRANPSEGLDNTRNDSFALSGGVTGNLVFFTGVRREAGGGKGSRGIP